MSRMSNTRRPTYPSLFTVVTWGSSDDGDDFANRDIIYNDTLCEYSLPCVAVGRSFSHVSFSLARVESYMLSTTHNFILYYTGKPLTDGWPTHPKRSKPITLANLVHIWDQTKRAFTPEINMCRRFIVLADCSHSGSLLDDPAIQNRTDVLVYASCAADETLVHNPDTVGRNQSPLASLLSHGRADQKVAGSVVLRGSNGGRPRSNHLGPPLTLTTPRSIPPLSMHDLFPLSAPFEPKVFAIIHSYTETVLFPYVDREPAVTVEGLGMLFPAGEWWPRELLRLVHSYTEVVLVARPLNPPILPVAKIQVDEIVSALESPPLLQCLARIVVQFGPGMGVVQRVATHMGLKVVVMSGNEFVNRSTMSPEKCLFVVKITDPHAHGEISTLLNSFYASKNDVIVVIQYAYARMVPIPSIGTRSLHEIMFKCGDLLFPKNDTLNLRALTSTASYYFSDTPSSLIL